MTVDVQTLPDDEHVAHFAASLLLKEIMLAITQRDACFVMLAGGKTPRRIYDVIVKEHQQYAPFYRKAHYFLGDERAVPVASHESNAGLACRHFITPLEIPAAQCIFPDGGAADLDAETERLNAAMRQIVPRNEQGAPVFDFIFLGMGNDGHTASLFPDTKALHETFPGYVVNDVPQHATKRITVTFPVLNAGRCVNIIATGASKAPVVSHVIGGSLSGVGQPLHSPDVPQYPIARVNPARLIWVLDAAASVGATGSTS